MNAIRSRFVTRFRFCQPCDTGLMQREGRRSEGRPPWLGLLTCLFVVSVSTGPALGTDRSLQVEEAGVPPNLSAAPVFKPYFDRMLLSPTFRSQCKKLGAAPVKVHVWLEDPQRRPSFNARTVFERHKGIVVAANVFLSPSPDAVEFIAHEIEHVLEQLDGVDLETQAGSGNAWKRGDGAFETRRAVETGVRVAREVKERSQGHQRSR